MYGGNMHAQSTEPVESLSPTSFQLGKTYTFYSAILQEKRSLNIYLPDSYTTDSSARFPVMYLMDGSANEDFIHICGLVQFLSMIGYIPPIIVAGVCNVDRRRDFTFPTRNAKDKKSYPTTGGSEKFIQFLARELVPFVNSYFRTNNSRIITGQSLGGLLATEILFQQPSLFNTYFIVSPSLWWDDQSLLKKASGLKQYNAVDSLHIFLAVGKEGKQMETDANNLTLSIKKYGPKNTGMLYQPFPKENHLTILHNAIYAALVWRFKNK